MKTTQMPYNSGTNNPIGQTPKQMGVNRPLAQTPYQTGSNQAKQGMQTAKSGSQYKVDLRDLIPSESW